MTPVYFLILDTNNKTVIGKQSTTNPEGFIIPNKIEVSQETFDNVDIYRYDYSYENESLSVVEKTILQEPTTEDRVTALEAEIFPVPNKHNVVEYQEYLVTQSKVMLAKYLENHPLNYTDGKVYTVTLEKQQLLTSNLMAYQLDLQQGTPSPELEWNDDDNICTIWTYESLSSLALAIRNYVKPFVSYQRAKELEIRACTTIEQLDAMVIDYAEI